MNPPPEVAMHVDRERLAELPAVEQSLDLGLRAAEAALVAHHQLHAVPLRRLDHVVAFGHRDRHRLLAKDVAPSRGGFHDDVAVRVMRCGDGNRVAVALRQQLAMITPPGHAVHVAAIPRRVYIHVGDAD